MKHVCVIGGGGFIGSCLVQQLVGLGRKVTVIGRQDSSPFDGQVCYLNTGKRSLSSLFDELPDVDEVVDLSYSTYPKTSFENPLKDIIDNLEVAVALFERLAKSGIGKMVYVSSGGAVYGQAIHLPIAEDHPMNPISPYGITKLAIEKYAQMYFQTQRLPIVIVRPGNAYGEGQAAFRGQGFVATAIASLLRKEPLKVYGQTGTVRDYVYVDDIATGILAALEFGEPGSCYNIGSGIGHTNMQVIDLLTSLLGLPRMSTKVDFLPSRPFDVAVNILNSNRLASLSGWKPKMNFRDGLMKTIHWHLANHSVTTIA